MPFQQTKISLISFWNAILPVLNSCSHLLVAVVVDGPGGRGSQAQTISEVMMGLTVEWALNKGYKAPYTLTDNYPRRIAPSSERLLHLPLHERADVWKGPCLIFL